MNWLNKLERKCGKICIPSLMTYLCVTMLAVYIMQFILGFDVISWIALDRHAIFQGQIWRLFTFIFVPPDSRVLPCLLGLYFYYIIGQGLEDEWGSFRFNFYYVCGMLGAILAALVTGYATSSYLNLSLFLAFAAIYPEHQVLLFYFLPIKVKYLAYLDWVLFAVNFVFGTLSVRATILFSVANYLIFFGPDLFRRMKNNRKYAAQRRRFRQQMRDQNDRYR